MLGVCKLFARCSKVILHEPEAETNVMDKEQSKTTVACVSTSMTTSVLSYTPSPGMNNFHPFGITRCSVPKIESHRLEELYVRAGPWTSSYLLELSTALAQIGPEAHRKLVA